MLNTSFATNAGPVYALLKFIELSKSVVVEPISRSYPSGSVSLLNIGIYATSPAIIGSATSFIGVGGKFTYKFASIIIVTVSVAVPNPLSTVYVNISFVLVMVDGGVYLTT